MTTKTSLLSLSLAISVTAAALFAGCGSSDDDAAPSNNVGFSGQSGAAGSGTAGSGNAGSGTAGSGTAGSGTAGSGTAGSSGSGGAGCFDKPKTTSEFLNQCTNSTCAPFDNAARLPLFQNGQLPPIP